MDDPAFVAGIMSLASMLKLPPPTPGEHKTTLKVMGNYHTSLLNCEDRVKLWLSGQRTGPWVG